jgi:hypothetical protein
MRSKTSCRVVSISDFERVDGFLSTEPPESDPVGEGLPAGLVGSGVGEVGVGVVSAGLVTLGLGDDVAGELAVGVGVGVGVTTVLFPVNTA